MKLKPLQDSRGYFVTFKYYGYHFLYLENAEKVRCFRYNAGVQGSPEAEQISMYFWLIGGPEKIVNADATIEKKIITYYNDEEIEWYSKI